MTFDPEKYQKENLKYTPKTYNKTSNKKVVFKYAAVPKENVNTLEGLQNYAAKLGMDVDIKPKESLFKKTVDFISRPLYASAGAAKALVKNYQAGTTVENPLLEAWKGLTEQEKETYSDVLAEAGVHNKWVKGGVGFALDVALDPTTYFGGAIIKGAGKVLGAGGRTAMKGITKFDPVVAQNLTATGKSIQDAFGRAFVKYSGGSTAKVMKDGKEITRYLGDDIGRALNKLGMEKENILKNMTERLGKYDKETLAKATDLMIENRRLELAQRKTLDKAFKDAGDIAKTTTETIPETVFKSAPDAITQEALMEMKNIGAEIGAKLDPDLPKYEWYYPMIDKTKIGTFSETGGSIMEKTKEGYLKEFQDKIADENILKKPIEALTRREAEIVRNNLAEELSKDAIQTYGASLDDFKKLSDGDFLTKYGRPKSEYQVIKSSMFGKELGALRKRDVELVKETLFPEMKTIDMLAKSVGYDQFTGIFKSAVTAWFPAFHARNFVSGIIQNYQVIGRQAFNPKNLGEGITMLKGSPNKVFNYKNFSGTAEELNKVFRENFETSSRYISDLGKEIDILSDGSYNLSKLNPRRLGNYIESLQKSQMVAAALRKGSTVDEAMRLARESGFDYTRITTFESKIMRRLVPFYSFARFNAELQLKTAVRNPERILSQIKFTQNLSEVFGGGKPTENDLAGLPNWALAGLGFKISGNRYLTKFGLPLEEFVNRVNDPMMSTLTSVNPIIKYPLESKLGYDFFREKKITDINQIAPGTGELLMSDKTPDWLKEIMNVQKSEYLGKVRYTASPEALHKLRNLPTARLQSTLESLFSNEKESVDKWLAFFSGARVYDIDTELQKYFKEKDMFEDIKQQMLLQGDIKEFNRVFIPNNEAK